MIHSPERWFPLRRSATTAPRVRLLCLPFAGASATAFSTWGARLASDIEFLPVELPGRGSRFNEPPAASTDLLSDALVQALDALPPLPLCLYGHSMGTLLAWHLARQLHARRQTPLGMILTGRHAPHWPQHPATPRHRLPDAALVTELRRLGGTPDEVFDTPELLELILPPLRADFALIENSTAPDPVQPPFAPLPIPALVIGGTHDADSPPASLEAWKQLLSLETECSCWPGGHFFIHQHRDALVDTLNERIHQWLATSPRHRIAQPAIPHD